MPDADAIKGFPSTDPVAATTRNELMDGPARYLYSIDFKQRLALFAEMTEAHYVETTFMDKRLKAVDNNLHGLPLDLLLRLFNDPGAPLPKPANLHFMMHVSHCGSTLLSRAIQALGAHCLREPLLLKDLCLISRAKAAGKPNPLPEQTYAHLLSAFEHLAARPWHAGQPTVIKPSSYVVSMTTELLQRLPASRAILLDVQPKRFLATILRREGSISEVNSALLRWHAHDPWLLFRERFEIEQLSPGEKAGLLYACNKGWMLSALANSEISDRLIAVDFDRFLENPKPHAVELMRFVSGRSNFTPSNNHARALDSVLGRNAKQGGVAYDANTRDDDLADSARTHRQEIDRGAALASQLLMQISTATPQG